MKTSDQIIIEELKRIVLMQSQEITRLIAKINVLEGAVEPKAQRDGLFSKANHEI